MPDELALPGELAVHPLADIFPIMTDEEIAELADDIAENGLIHPIMLDATGKTLVDGRNRLAACRLIGVDPAFDRLGEDVAPEAYIVAANLQRRNLTKGQAAMALAMIYPEPATLKRKEAADIRPPNISAERLSKARTVVRFGAKDLVPFVLGGSKSLDDAYAEARRRQVATESEETKLARLRNEAPDLSNLVGAEDLEIDEAIAALEQRKAARAATIREGRRHAEALASSIRTSVSAIEGAINCDDRDAIRALLDKDALDEISNAIAGLRRKLAGRK